MHAEVLLDCLASSSSKAWIRHEFDDEKSMPLRVLRRIDVFGF
jgi:hypothetical protein